MSQDLVVDNRGVSRCWWCGDDPQYLDYHDREWGRPVLDDKRLFEKICLEGFQAGLSWLTILRKREAFREGFADFNFERVATFTAKDVDRLVKDSRIVRHRGKIESTINNAARAIELCEEFGSLADYFWGYRPHLEIPPESRSQVVSVTQESKAMGKDLKKRGWSFVGPTTCYAFMQAMGLVNDHLQGCHARNEVERELLQKIKN